MEGSKFTESNGVMYTEGRLYGWYGGRRFRTFWVIFLIRDVDKSQPLSGEQARSRAHVDGRAGRV